MVTANVCSVNLVNRHCNCIANLNRCKLNFCFVKIITVLCLCCINNICSLTVYCDSTYVTYLTAHFSIERSFICNDKSLLIFDYCITNALVLNNNADNFCICFKCIVTDKYSRLCIFKFKFFVTVPA